ncbi:MAG TPA: hypothetical protein VNX68_12880 [Nitrosopumilaceae archaeon]|jgi:hypothetical protein|nr:hypothetical protein [Nitrosopumilaceae archaeon]
MIQELNYYKSVKQPTVVKNITVNEWIEEIKTGNQFGELIKDARVWGKESSMYDSIKLSLPCITWNFMFNVYKNDQNITNSTGYMFFDIDSYFELPVEIESKVFLCAKSFGGVGSVIVVKCSGITQNNFNESYKEIATELGIVSLMDLNAIKKTQFTVITYDKNIFINNESKVFYPSFTLYTLPLPSSSRVYLVNDGSITKNKDEEWKKELTLFHTIRLTNATDFVTNGEDYQTFIDKKDVIRITLPKPYSLINKRNSILSSILSSMLRINPDVPKINAYKWICDVNQSICKIPLKDKEITSIFNSNWNKRGVYNVKSNSKRTVIFKKGCKLSKEEKQSIAAQEMGHIRKQRTHAKLQKAIDEWDKSEKMTQKTISLKLGISENTIRKYWKKLDK